MIRRRIGIVFATLMLALFFHGQAQAVTTGTANGTYDFGRLGAVDSAGSGSGLDFSAAMLGVLTVTP